MRAIDQDEFVSQFRRISSQSEAHYASPVVTHDDCAEIFVVLIGSLLVLFSHGDYELGHGVKHSSIRLLERVASSVVRQIKTHNSCRLYWHARLFHAKSPHHTAVGETVQKDEQIATLGCRLGCSVREVVQSEAVSEFEEGMLEGG